MFMAPAYRSDVVIDFSSYNIGDSVILQNTLGSGTTAEIMRFDITRDETDSSTIPEELSTITPIPTTGAVNRTFTFQRARQGGPFTINNLAYDPNRIDASPTLGDTEIWTLTNEMNMDHPIHIHDIMCQVLEIEGAAPSATHYPELIGWKDTFNLPPLATAKVIGQFTDFTGIYMMHCHNLEHEDYAMMMNFEVVP
jgi:spore coat protein A